MADCIKGLLLLPVLALNQMPTLWANTHGPTGVALAGHAILTNINKRKDINTLTAEGEAGDVDVIE